MRPHQHERAGDDGQPEYPRGACKQTFLTWRWLAGVLLASAVALGSILWATAVARTEDRNAISNLRAQTIEIDRKCDAVITSGIEPKLDSLTALMNDIKKEMRQGKRNK